MSMQAILDYLWAKDHYSLAEIQLDLEFYQATKKQISEAITAYVFEFKDWNLYVASKK